MPFKRAVKYDARLRMAIAGPSGSGKTFTALTLACALAGDKRVAVIDTERGSASKYALTKDGKGFDFDVMELTNYDPKNFIAAIHEAEQAGYGVIVIDSLSHAWNGQGGVLEIVDNTAKRSQSKNTFNAWGEGTKLQNQLIDTMTRSPMHIIVTMRSKTEYVIEQVNGKNMPRKVGMAPVQRADVEYEFDVYGEMTVENTMLVQKSRCSDLSGQVIDKPGVEVAQTLANWLSGEGSAPEPVVSTQVESAPLASNNTQQVAKPATQNGNTPTIPNFAQLRNLAERYYPDGWVGLRTDMINEHQLGDIDDADWSEDLRKLAYAKVKAAKEAKQLVGAGTSGK